MLGNMYALKKKMHPEWYENGPVKILTPAEIAAWEASPEAKPTLDKMAAYAETPRDLTEFLDALTLREAEEDFVDLIKGEAPRADNEQP